MIKLWCEESRRRDFDQKVDVLVVQAPNAELKLHPAYPHVGGLDNTEFK